MAIKGQEGETITFTITSPFIGAGSSMSFTAQDNKGLTYMVTLYVRGDGS